MGTTGKIEREKREWKAMKMYTIANHSLSSTWPVCETTVQKKKKHYKAFKNESYKMILFTILNLSK